MPGKSSIRKTIGDFRASADLSEMAIQLQAARLLVYNAAFKADQAK